jgi:hypothetical protein
VRQTFTSRGSRVGRRTSRPHGWVRPLARFRCEPRPTKSTMPSCVFGSQIDGRFCLDTVFVVAESMRYTVNEAVDLPVDDTFRACTIESLAAYEHHAIDLRAAQFTLYLGATNENPVDGMFSFTPALPVGADGPRFARPAYDDRRFVNPESKQSAVRRESAPTNGRGPSGVGRSRAGVPAGRRRPRRPRRPPQERRHDQAVMRGRRRAMPVNDARISSRSGCRQRRRSRPRSGPGRTSRSGDPSGRTA